MKVEIKQSKLEHEGFVRVIKANLRFERFNGQMSDEVVRFHYHRSDAVAVLIYDDVNQHVLLIRQFRYAVHTKTGDGWLTECVAGMMEQNETPLDVAHREVLEETGLKLLKLELLAHYFFLISGGFHSRRANIGLGRAGICPVETIAIGGRQPIVGVA